jgi:hypothetical protein
MPGKTKGSQTPIISGNVSKKPLRNRIKHGFCKGFLHSCGEYRQKYRGSLHRLIEFLGGLLKSGIGRRAFRR